MSLQPSKIKLREWPFNEPTPWIASQTAPATPREAVANLEAALAKMEEK